jgi:hypothetical protein
VPNSSAFISNPMRGEETHVGTSATVLLGGGHFYDGVSDYNTPPPRASLTMAFPIGGHRCIERLVGP